MWKSQTQKKVLSRIFSLRFFHCVFFYNLVFGHLTHITTQSAYHSHGFFFIFDTNMDIFQFWENYHDNYFWWKLKHLKLEFRISFIIVRIWFDLVCTNILKKYFVINIIKYPYKKIQKPWLLGRCSDTEDLAWAKMSLCLEISDRLRKNRLGETESNMRPRLPLSVNYYEGKENMFSQILSLSWMPLTLVSLEVLEWQVYAFIVTL